MVAQRFVMDCMVGTYRTIRAAGGDNVRPTDKHGSGRVTDAGCPLLNSMVFFFLPRLQLSTNSIRCKEFFEKLNMEILCQCLRGRWFDG